MGILHRQERVDDTLSHDYRVTAGLNATPEFPKT